MLSPNSLVHPIFSQRHYYYCYLATFFSISVALLVWFPAIFTPLWGDDYFFLQNAKEYREAGVSWLAPFFNTSDTAFWRPLSMDLPWRFIEDILGGDPVRAHLFSSFFWLLSVTAVANLGYRIALIKQWSNAGWIASLSGLLYGFHGVHILVLHWVSAINSAILVIFVVCTLTTWIAAFQADGLRQKTLSFFTMVFLLLSLFSKEIAILLPVLMVVLAIFLYGLKLPGAVITTTFVLCIGVCLVWLYYFHLLTPIRYSAYEIVPGLHILKNSMLLAAWLFNVPREALRLFVSGDIYLSVLWISACSIPMLIFVTLCVRGLSKSLSLLQWLTLIAFCASAYAPYFLLREQSYEYYAAIALILPAIVLAKGLSCIRAMPVALIFFTISSLVSIVGNRVLDYPSLIGRAIWAEEQLDYLVNNTSSDALDRPVPVSFSHYHQFAAIEISGLAWRLDIPREQVVLTKQCLPLSPEILVQGSDGNFVWKNCP